MALRTRRPRKRISFTAMSAVSIPTPMIRAESEPLRADPSPYPEPPRAAAPVRSHGFVHATGEAGRDYGATRLGFVPVGMAPHCSGAPRPAVSQERRALGAPIFAGNRYARWMYDSVRLQPARQSKAVASSLIGDDAPDFAPGLDGFAAPAAQQPEHRIRVGIELLERITFKARDRRSNEPLCLAHLNHCEQSDA